MPGCVAAALGAGDPPRPRRPVPPLLRLAGAVGGGARRRCAARRAARAVDPHQDDRRSRGRRVHRAEPADAADRARPAGGAQPRAQLPPRRGTRARVRGAAARPRSACRAPRSCSRSPASPKRRMPASRPCLRSATRPRRRCARRSASPTTTPTWSGREVCTILLHHRLRIQAAISAVRRAADRGDARGADPLARRAVRPERAAAAPDVAARRRPPASTASRVIAGGFVSMSGFVSMAQVRGRACAARPRRVSAGRLRGGFGGHAPAVRAPDPARARLHPAARLGRLRRRVPLRAGHAAARRRGEGAAERCARPRPAAHVQRRGRRARAPVRAPRRSSPSTRRASRPTAGRTS